ncbi:MAG: HEPN domain-containing protein [Nanoarchaeota archaeon]|nr:HEPN domain-containing protein [Nanoarchaeota archaeon]
MPNQEIKKDLKRAQEALESAKRNLKENDILTAANRTFVACENSVYILLKSKFGSTSVSRMKILTRLKEIDPEAKDTYDKSYDLRVQADYGKEAKILPLNKETMNKILEKVKSMVKNVNKIVEEKDIHKEK